MAFIRNNIEIEGINQGSTNFNSGYMFNYFENGPIFIPKSKGKIKYLNKVIIEINSIEGRVIDTPSGKILNIYGRKLYTLMYSERSHDRTQKTVLDLPFIAYVYLPAGVEDFSNLEVSVLDAFFEVIDNRKIYNNIVYLIKFNKKDKSIAIIDNQDKHEIQNQLTLSDLERMILNSPLKDVFTKGSMIQGEQYKEPPKLQSKNDSKEDSLLISGEEKKVIEANKEDEIIKSEK